MLSGVAVVILGAIFAPVTVPLGLVLLGIAFADVRYSSQGSRLLTPRALLLTAVIAGAAITITVLLSTVPELHTDWKTHTSNDGLIMMLFIIQIMLMIWLAAASGYLGYAAWVRFRHGEEAPEESED